jgi:predicted GIY-YIG superfamily endonuclease
MSATKKKLMRPGGWYLYILKCCDGTFYTGITNNLARRIEQHNDGNASRYTRSRTPVILIYKEACKNKSSALKKECRIKALTRIEKEEYIGAKEAQDAQRKLKRGLHEDTKKITKKDFLPRSR